jgi:amino acid adenylation domain-containing protein
MCILRMKTMEVIDISQYQKRFWIEWKLYPNRISYNTPLIFEMRGKLNSDALLYALETFINHYDEGCRSYFIEEQQVVKQVILDNMKVEIEVRDRRDNENSEEIKTQFIDTICSHLFDLTKPPLYKFGLVNLAHEHAILVLNFHHIISDGVTASHFIKIISDLYNHFHHHGSLLEHKPFMPFKAYIKHEKENYTADQQMADLKYWENLLVNAETYLRLPTQTVRESNKETGQSIYFNLESDLSSRLKKLAREQNSSLFIILAAIYGVLLLRYANQSSFVLNYPVNMRPPGFREKTGCYVNNVLFKIAIKPTQTFAELLHDLTVQRKNTKQHQQCSLTTIVQHLREKKILNGNHFFNVDFYEAYLGLLPLNLEEVTVQPISPKQAEMMNDIGLAYQQNNGVIEFKLEYKTELFDSRFIHQLIQQFTLLIKKVIDDGVHLPLFGFSLLSEEDYKKIIYEWNGTSLLTQQRISFCTLFDSTVARCPDAIAVSVSGQALTYRELDEKANQLARYLDTQSIGSECYVGVFIKRSPEMLIAMLAILKVGAVYVPLDPGYPESRTNYIIHDSMMKLIITLDHLAEKLEKMKVTTLCLDSHGHLVDRQEKNYFSSLIHPQQAAYVIYTSGSTGKPKGVVVNHASLINHNRFTQHYYGLTEQDIVLQFSSINFDISIEEIFPTLVSGGTLVLYPDHQGLSLKTFHHLIKDQKITCLNLPTAFWHALTNELQESELMDLKTLRLVVVGGEQPHYNALMRWKQFFGQRVRWINTYGPTEGTVIAATWEPTPDVLTLPEENHIPIGKPIAHCQLYITDAQLNPVPVGVTGELLIAGENVARCYLQNADLTADKFMPDPFSQIPGSRLYRTGDIARYRHDGTIEYVGRMDHQIKIQGYRVELGEIEAVITSCPNICEAVVVAHKVKDQHYRLLAYVVIAHKDAHDTESLKKLVGQFLPEYMVPSAFIVMESMPLTPNGKINKAALPIPDYSINKNYIAANTKIEKQLTDICQSVLHVEKISIEDNFFDLGAHSLLLLKIHKQIEETLCISLPIMNLFEHSTIKKLAAFISTRHDSSNDTQAAHNANRQRIAFARQRQMQMRKNHERA